MRMLVGPLHRTSNVRAGATRIHTDTACDCRGHREPIPAQRHHHNPPLRHSPRRDLTRRRAPDQLGARRPSRDLPHEPRKVIALRRKDDHQLRQPPVDSLGNRSRAGLSRIDSDRAADPEPPPAGILSTNSHHRP